jgi:predicted nucleic acid-binding Zn ribbon protein
LISRGSGIIFKGSGFYVNDYKKSESSTTSSQTSPPASPSTSSTPKPTSTES